ncbi:exo-alpha-sialidase [Litorilinea aerophila]|uniref:Exo-alpha-sialidase n=1 Tax=Litorilinea aerophila TaxID=1204385 RepID=A0A540V9K5_9CHLR|nr:exo-alpha-sialidase [Litorilinea aerophila]MCC9078663.1 exo-alpha-sialidase [Litorilinea aerophila]
MGRALTKRHAGFFERRIRNPLSFVYDIYQYGKARELLSFLVWESFHRLHLFPKSRYLRFTPHEPLILRGDQPDSPAFGDRLCGAIQDLGLTATPSPHNWKLFSFGHHGEMIGCLYPDDRALYVSTDGGDTVKLVTRFPERIKAIFVSSRNVLFVCVKGAVYRSANGGDSFARVLNLGSSESFFRHNNAMTETPDGTLLIGEYGNVWEGNRWRKLAYLYFSADEGRTWQRSDFLIHQGINKHVHLVKYSRIFNRIFMADGDNYKKLWVCDSLDFTDLLNPEHWHPVNRFHIQMGGYTAAVECDGRLFFGTDYQGGTNFLVYTSDGYHFEKKVIPDPYRRSPIDNMVLRRSRDGIEIWALLPYSAANTRCLLMVTKDGGETWSRVIEYSRDTHKVWLLNTSDEIADELYVSVEAPDSGKRAVYQIADL